MPLISHSNLLLFAVHCIPEQPTLQGQMTAKAGVYVYIYMYIYDYNRLNKVGDVCFTYTYSVIKM